MFVNTNVAALNAWRNLENTQNDMKGVLQQLSSGYRINTAADDPAGLAISQQMQSQIGGLNQAYLNSQSGVSLLQTADGALGQIQNILQSMRSLASEASTATMNPTDTQNLQTEMNQYTQEITQITNTTQFNNINLLGGSFTGQNLQVGANQGQSLGVSLSAADAYSLGVTGQTASITTPGQVASSVTDVSAMANDAYTLSSTVTPWSATLGGPNTADFVSLNGSYAGTTADTAAIKVTTAQVGGTTAAQIQVTDGGQNITYTAAGNVGNSVFNNVSIGGTKFTLTMTAGAALNDNYTAQLNPTSTTFTVKDNTTNATATTTQLGQLTSGQNISTTFGSGAVSYNIASNVANETSGALTTNATGGNAALGALTSTVFSVSQSGAAASSYSNGTGNATATTGIDITTQSGAQAALSVIDTAINTLSNQRANVGAYQNRLQFAASDVQTVSQNLTAARAGIMDADMAQTMSNLSRDQVLEQSGVAMLAQANSVPQALLKLLP